jgi:hypothetical protein
MLTFARVPTELNLSESFSSVMLRGSPSRKTLALKNLRLAESIDANWRLARLWLCATLLATRNLLEEEVL